MRLESGIRVPPFALTDLEGEPVTPEHYAGRKLWLILGRFVACPFCSLRLQEVIGRGKSIADAGVDVLVVFPSKPKRVQRFVEKYEPPFRVVADPEQKIFDQFGSETSWAGELRTAINVPKVFRALAKTKMNPLAIDDKPHRMPSEYLIDPDGTIAEVYYGGELDDGFDIATVMRWAKS